MGHSVSETLRIRRMSPTHSYRRTRVQRRAKLKSFWLGIGISILLLLPPSQLSSQGVEMGISGGMTSSLDDDFENGELGGLVGAFLLFGDGSTKGGVELNYGRFDLGGEGFNQADALGSARYVLPAELSRLFLGAKVGYLTHWAEVEQVDIQVSGIGYGPTLGLRGSEPDGVFELEATLLRMDLGNVKLDGDEISKTRSEGWKVYVKVNYAIPRGGS